MEFSQMTQKWSSKSKEHNTIRVRNNQRRHRARVKAYVAELEQQLADTRSRLDETLAQNHLLASELEGLRARSVDVDSPTSSITAPDSDDCSSSPQPVLLDTTRAFLLPSPLALQAVMPTNPIPVPTQRSEGGSIRSLSMRSPDHASLSESQQPCACASAPCSTPSTLALSSDEADFATLRNVCSRLPPPAPGESTIPCEVAYGIVKQQNYAGLDVTAIHAFLRPGFRGGTFEGDGCRVESSLVFAVIDTVSS